MFLIIIVTLLSLLAVGTLNSFNVSFTLSIANVDFLLSKRIIYDDIITLQFLLIFIINIPRAKISHLGFFFFLICTNMQYDVLKISSEGALSGLRQFWQLKVLKKYKKCVLFHLESCFCSKDN